MINYKQVNIYVDNKFNLIFLANGLIDKWGGVIASIDVVEELHFPYETAGLQSKLTSVFNKCHSMIPEEDGKSPLEKYLGVNSFEKAIKGRKMIVYSWNIDVGFTVTPTKKIKKGFEFIEEREIQLGHKYSEEELFKAINLSIQIAL